MWYVQIYSLYRHLAYIVLKSKTWKCASNGIVKSEKRSQSPRQLPREAKMRNL